MQFVERSGVLEFADKIMYEHGFYKATLLHEGDRAKQIAAFFPSHWPREKVISKIYEAYENFVKSGAKDFVIRDGKYVIRGAIEEGIEIEIRVTLGGKIVTAYPVLH
jgi:EndoU nuclease-like protein